MDGFGAFMELAPKVVITIRLTVMRTTFKKLICFGILIVRPNASGLWKKESRPTI